MKTPDKAAAETAPPANNPHIDADALSALEAEASQAMQPGAAAPEPAAPEVPTSQVLEGLIGPAFAVLAPNWKVSHGEVKQLCFAYGLLIDKYFPDSVSKFGPEIMATTLTLAVIGPRIAAKVPPRLEEKKPEAATNAGAG